MTHEHSSHPFVKKEPTSVGQSARGRKEEDATKLQLACAINRAIKLQCLGQVAAARILGIRQPKVSAIANYRLEGFSIQRLMEYLAALGTDIEIIIHAEKTSKKARITVRCA